MNESVNILNQFGFEIAKEQKSIYPFSPVYKVGNYIVKRTKFPLEKANNLVKYLMKLNVNNIPIVTPIKLKGSNPKQIDNDCYICYPFIDGSSYSGITKEIVQAGELLGHIHKLSCTDNAFHLEKYDVFDFYYHEVDDHIKEIKKFVDYYKVDIDVQHLKNLLYQAVYNQKDLKNTSLEWVETPHDYKANNLIFNSYPIIIDPDNAKWIPRTFDLALALLLFHNELSSAPNRVFTPNEWSVFLNGYLAHQTLTEVEIKTWDKTVLHVFLDEVMWLMAKEDGDWKVSGQRELFVSITSILFNMDRYAINK